jgi:hypothetical protein
VVVQADDEVVERSRDVKALNLLIRWLGIDHQNCCVESVGCAGLRSGMAVRPCVIESGRMRVDGDLMAVVLVVGCNEMGRVEVSRLRFLVAAS